MPQFTSPRPLVRGLLKPRNPLVALSHMRKGGRHQAPHQRQSAQRQIRQELRQAAPP